MFAREYKIFWSKLTKRFGAGGVGGGGGPGGGGRGDELIKPDGTYNVVNGTIPTDQDLIQVIRSVNQSVFIIWLMSGCFNTTFFLRITEEDVLISNKHIFATL